MQGLTYAVDLVLCIDKTGSMSSVIDRVKANALRFSDDLKSAMDAKNKQIDFLRIRIIAFGDVWADGDDWLRASDFFDLPASNAKFRDFVAGLSADGGDDEPENGLEALVMALRSDWTRNGDRRRHVIVIWTDASAHPLEKAASSRPSSYPSGMPGSFDELTDLWDGQTMSRSSRRLVMFAPDAYPWSDIETNWDETIQFPSQAGLGLQEMEYKFILDAIANSI